MRKLMILFFLLVTLVCKSQVGYASYYGKEHHGKLMANGKKFNMYALTCAHKNLKFGTKLEVTNLKNNKKVIITVTDRGPFIKNRVLDLSKAAADSLNFKGVIKVSYKIIK